MGMHVVVSANGKTIEDILITRRETFEGEKTRYTHDYHYVWRDDLYGKARTVAGAVRHRFSDGSLALVRRILDDLLG